MMFALLTKQPDGSFDLPIVWMGRTAKAAQQYVDVALAGDVFLPRHNSSRKAHGLFPVDLDVCPAGKLIVDTVYSFLSGRVIQEFIVAPDPDYVTPDPLASTRAMLVQAVKGEAGRRIVAVAPEWKQRNLTVQAAILAKQVADGTLLTPEQQANWDAGQLIWQQVDAIRSRSDVIEAQIAGMDLGTAQGFDPTDDGVWL